jgi:ABC-type uncharacterized transport system substrate-binding protein
MRRRDFVRGIAGSTIAWPLAARAQQPGSPAMPVIGFLNGQSPKTFAHLLAGFWKGLNETGFVEGRNVAIEYRWAEGQTDRLPAMARDLVIRQVAVLAATGGADRAAKAATNTIPIVFTTGGEPVQAGLVQSFNRPGGNATGVSVFTTVLEAKRFELLHELVPSADIIGILVDPTFEGADVQLREVQLAAQVLGRPIRVLNASTEQDIAAAFATLMQIKAGALAVFGNPFLNGRRAELVALAAHHAIPAMYEAREFTAASGLMSYGPSITDVYRQAGVYAGRILKGEKPADLPVVQPTRFEFSINLRTAKVLRLQVPPMLLARADEVIE